MVEGKEKLKQDLINYVATVHLQELTIQFCKFLEQLETSQKVIKTVSDAIGQKASYQGELARFDVQIPINELIQNISQIIETHYAELPHNTERDFSTRR